MTQTPEQHLLIKLYECQDEIESYINKISVDDVRELHYKTVLTLLTTKKDLGDLISKLEVVICDKQELM
jgi:hypothetical protein